MHIRAEKQERGAVQAELQLGQIPCIVEVDAVGTTDSWDDITTPVEEGESITGFERARPLFLEGDDRLDRER